MFARQRRGGYTFYPEGTIWCESPEWMSSGRWEKESVVGGKLGMEEMREPRNNMNKEPLKEGHKAERSRQSLALCHPQRRRLLFARSFHCYPRTR